MTLMLCSMAMNFEHALILTDQLENQGGYYQMLGRESLLAGFGAIEEITCTISQLEQKVNKEDWYLGFLAYDLKNELHQGLKSNIPARVQFPSLFFFRPRWLVRASENSLQIGYDDQHDSVEGASLFANELLKPIPSLSRCNPGSLKLQPGINKKAYIEAFNSLEGHIRRGDIYEVNYCLELFDNQCDIDPPLMFDRLVKRSPMPFSAFLKFKCKHALCASPERYLARKDGLIYSMPMKGTAPRGMSAMEDKEALERLISSLKERSENIMITDLVRNDLSRVAARGSVKVNELCKPYPFPGLFQVVSTVSAKPKNAANWSAPILSSFPMGSMTGAPKISAMSLIDMHEPRGRGLFSGAIGYIRPDKDFDFNVVIRTLFYDRDEKTASFYAGSAITSLSNATDEYNECMLKARIVTETFS